MVGSSDGNIIVNSGKLPCGVCGKEVQANDGKYTVCKRWIHNMTTAIQTFDANQQLLSLGLVYVLTTVHATRMYLLTFLPSNIPECEHKGLGFENKELSIHS